MYRKVIGVGALMVAFAACGGGDDVADDTAMTEEMETAAEPMAEDVPGLGEEAIAHVINDQGTEIGTVRLTQQADGVEIVVDLAFLQAGERAFHIHETGSCETPDFTSAGGHFNPTNVSHGTNSPDGPHAGDMENLEVETDDGTARATITNDRITLAQGQPNSVFDADGSAFVLHQGADDYTSQPSGDAGARIACGVIEPA